MLDILQREEYGYIPPPPDKLSFRVHDGYIPNFCAGKASSRLVEAEMEIAGKPFSFPFHVAIPKRAGKHPFFVCINFRPAVPDRYIPTEEIIDNGFAVLSFCYTDVTSDDGDFRSGLSAVLYPEGKREPTSAGKLALWAFAAQRVMDYAVTIEELDPAHSAVCGHSRLGKTALLAAATDERFRLAYSNDSGCSGAALSRGKRGENVKSICSVFPFWFCENYLRYSSREEKMPFDQHYLLASIAPRLAYVASAAEDDWADPVSEFLTCAATSPVYECFGLSGLVCGDELPTVGTSLHAGSVGYHLRAGLHYFSRTDWLELMRFAREKWQLL